MAARPTRACLARADRGAGAAIAMDHVDRIMTVMEGAFEPEYCEAWSRRQVMDALLIGNCHYLLAGPDGTILPEDAGADVPSAGFTLSRHGFGEEELLLIGVLPQYRRGGIAGHLLQRLAADAKDRNAERLLLEMRDGNPAETLYRRHGFAPIGRRPNYYKTLSGTRIDAITFAAALD